MVVGRAGVRQWRDSWRGAKVGAVGTTSREGLESGELGFPRIVRTEEASLGRHLVQTLLVVSCLAGVVAAQCAKDHRSEKSPGILVTEFTVTGTSALSASQLARITGTLTGGVL